MCSIILYNTDAIESIKAILNSDAIGAYSTRANRLIIDGFEATTLRSDVIFSTISQEAFANDVYNATDI